MKESNKKYSENLKEIEEKAKRLEALINLSNQIRDSEIRIPMFFNDFLYMASKKPELVFRNIFQLFHDMVRHYIPEGRDEYGTTPESIGFLDYNSSKLFVEGLESPFFADRLFSNRFMNLIKGFRQGDQHNRIFLFEGPPGSGKSTFLNNILQKFEEYTQLSQGSIYKTHWRIDIEKAGGLHKFESRLNKLSTKGIEATFSSSQLLEKIYSEKYFEISCPNHDHPILQIPKSLRKKFLEELIPDKKFKERLFNSKEYNWVLKDIPCSICSSIFNTLMDNIGDPLEVFNMINARKATFNRQFGIGISVYNPGDEYSVRPITNEAINNKLNEIFKNNDIRYVYSHLANTNNGILVLMDIKENNIERLKDLHGIISDEVHKVEYIEERIKTFFIGLVNPEDKVHFENIKSFQDRIITVKVPYILDYNTEVAIYTNKFGDEVISRFLPRVLGNFAKIIISSRLEPESPTIRRWIDINNYSKHLDRHALLLKMDIYTGKIPTWLTEEDIKKFDRETRKALINESEDEGKIGISGRQSLNIFNTFITKYLKNDTLITMDMVVEFIKNYNKELDDAIPEDFIDSLLRLYDYNVLEEVKESIYYYNENQISRDIQNYLYGINFESGDTVKCAYTGDKLEITEEFFKNFEAIFLGTTSTARERKSFRSDMQNEYVTKTLAQDIRLNRLSITETEQYQTLFQKYIKNLKENALVPYIDNDNFRQAIKKFGTKSFETYDQRIKRDVTLLIENLRKKFKYTKQGAIQVSTYVLEKKLAKKY